ncbi:MAG: sulfatase-like hydrolase/transferase [Ruminococcus sp.]|jgi:hypothetical protein|nr:sulfatase-like hydrolase/transferase [Ruminococcus sp.]
MRLTEKIASVPKKKKITLAAVCFTLIFTYGFFAPLDLYLRNSTSFMVGIASIVIPFFLISTAVFALLYFLLLFTGEKAIDKISLFLLGLIISSYSQLLFFNGEMGAMTGAVYNYSEFTTSHMINTVIFIYITFIPLFVVYALKKKGKKADFYKPAIAISAVIIVMQLGAIISVLPSYTPIKRTSLALSYSKSFEMSSEENTVVFIVDRLDNEFTHETFNRYPDAAEIFDGFTWYEDNTSVYSCTVPSVAYMLTGAEFNRDEPVYSYLRDCWKERSFIDTLKENNYNSYMLIDRFTSYTDVSDLLGKADNISDKKDVSAVNQSKLLAVTFRIAVSKLVPYFLKDAALEGLATDFQNNYLSMSDTDSMEYVVSFNTDMRFYDNLTQNGLKLQDDKKVFSVIHLRGAHDWGVGYDNGFIQAEGLDNSDAAYASFKIIEEYMKQMKALGIYDKSTIIVMADHGNSSEVMASTTRLDKAITSALMIKPKNASGALEINDTAELSHEFFGASVLEYAGIPHENYGLSYQDIINGNISTTRRLYIESWVNVYNLKYNGYYEINGDARDFNNWKAYE